MHFSALFLYTMDTISLNKWLATFGGIGYIRFAPGTFGALAAALISLVLSGCFSTYYSFQVINLMLIVLSYIVGVNAVNKIKHEWGSDPSRVVIDEACGLWVSLIFIKPDLQNLIIAFIFFRFFDILKPLGIKKIDGMHDSSHAVMLDDVLAGLYAALLTYFVQFIWK